MLVIEKAGIDKQRQINSSIDNTHFCYCIFGFNILDI